MPTPENPQFIPDETGETLGAIRFRDFPVGQVYETSDDPFKHREVITTKEPNYDLLEVVFLRDPKHSKQRPDITDLPLEFRADDQRREFLQEKALDAIRAGGFDPLPIPPRYSQRPPTGENEAQKSQAFVTDPYHEVFTTEHGVRVHRDRRKRR